MELLSEHGCHGGVQRFYQHQSAAIGLPMRFSVYLPPQALAPDAGRLPTLFYLAGLTCTEETFMIKAGAQQYAAQHGLILVAPDTSPRGAHVPGEADAWDFGVGAGFYVDAIEAPWRMHWRMESYVADELFHLVTNELPADAARVVAEHPTRGLGRDRHVPTVWIVRGPEVEEGRHARFRGAAPGRRRPGTPRAWPRSSSGAGRPWRAARPRSPPG